MRKSWFLSLILVSITLLPVKADEGMWLLPLLEKLNKKQMTELGFTITPDQIYSINHSSLKDAIVQFGGGCTGEIVSSKGLLLTNHHCGYGSIQKLSSVEHNYLKDGYWAMNLQEELPAEGLTVTFMESFTDVTKVLENSIKKAKTAVEEDSLFNLAQEELVSKAVGDDKNLSAEVVSFYGGNSFYLIVYKTFSDIRFVGAPPSSIGKFGADTDNWMWPRHTCDFSVFRVYADKNNNPAPYSEDNVPYTPKQFLKISLKGVQPNDPTMIMGYPGSTNRFMTRSELVETRDISNSIRIRLRGIRQEILMADMQADPAIMIQYASKYSGSSNGWKKWIGMNETFNKLNVEERRAAEESRFNEWIGMNKKRQTKYEFALPLINSAIDGRKEVLTDYYTASESIARIELYLMAARTANAINKANSDIQSAQSQRILSNIKGMSESFYKDYSLETDRKIAKTMIKVFRDATPAEKLPSFYAVIDSLFSGSIDAYVDNIFDNSVYTSKEKFESFLATVGTDNYKSIKEDPIYSLSSSQIVSHDMLDKLNESSAIINEGKKAYIAGTLEMRKGEAIYPDANFTMRLTYGSVLPYSPRDAVFYDYYTTLDGVMEKEDPNNWEFVVPARLKELWKNKDFGQYALPNGKMPTCFLSNNDITGGNSGSPIMNGAGELLGLAFDGNWESMSGDVIFEPDLQRCINVDIRYVLFIMDKFGGAGYLLDEMDIIK